MNKTTVKKLEQLGNDFLGNEESIEQKFTAKQVAIMRYRLGIEGGRKHELSEVAQHFDCSVSYVTKIMRKLAEYVAKAEPASDTTKVGVMSGKIDEDGNVLVEGPDPEAAKELQKSVQNVVDAINHKEKLNESMGEVAKQAKDLQRQASRRALWSVILMIVATVFLMIGFVRADAADALRTFVTFSVAAVAAAIALIVYVSGVAKINRCAGLIDALRAIKD